MRSSLARFALRAVGLVGVTFVVAVPARAQDGTASTRLDRIDWAAGPVKGRLNDVAEVGVPAGCRFTDAKGAKQFMELTENPPSGHEAGVVLCSEESGKRDYWFVVFEY